MHPNSPDRSQVSHIFYSTALESGRAVLHRVLIIFLGSLAGDILIRAKGWHETLKLVFNPTHHPHLSYHKRP